MELTASRPRARAVEVRDCRETLLRAALEVLAAERGLIDLRASIGPLGTADASLGFAARNLARAIDELPEAMQPRGWSG